MAPVQSDAHTALAPMDAQSAFVVQRFAQVEPCIEQVAPDVTMLGTHSSPPLQSLARVHGS